MICAMGLVFTTTLTVIDLKGLGRTENVKGRGDTSINSVVTSTGRGIMTPLLEKGGSRTTPVDSTWVCGRREVRGRVFSDEMSSGWEAR